MDDLIVRYLQGHAGPDEVERLTVWRLEPENDLHFRIIRAIWRLTGEGRRVAHEATPDLGRILAAAGRQDPVLSLSVAEVETANRPLGRMASAFRGSWMRRCAVGAMAAGLVGIGAGLGFVLAGWAAPTSLLAQSEIVTGAGEMTTVTLGDGSSIRVGPSSHLRLAQERRRRMAWLDGRAFFGVHADSTRPFTVQTQYGRARAFGTRFEVRSEEDEFRVLVVEGNVAVSAGGSEVNVAENEMSRSVRGQRPSTEHVDDVLGRLDWLGKALVFEATPLRYALKEVERRYGVNVTLDDPSLGDVTITASFTGQSVQEVMLVLCEAVGADVCTVKGDEVHVGVAKDRKAARA